MCFSLQASALAAAVLLPAGGLALRECRLRDRLPLQPLACCPLVFGLQQAAEGVVWWSLDQPALSPATLRLQQPAALLFLLLAYGFWPAWIPWCALQASRLQPPPAPRSPAAVLRWWLLRLLLALGLLLGLALVLPLLLDPARIQPTVVHGSIDYRVLLPGHRWVSHGLVVSFYGLVVLLPLLLAGGRRLRWFGGCLAASLVVAWISSVHAFTSVWCFLAALLALLLPWVVRQPL